MMAKDPESRYDSADAVVQDIRSLVATGVAPGAMDTELNDAYVSPLPELPGAARPLPGSARDFVVHYVESDSAWAEWIHLQLVDAGYVGDLEAWNFKTSHESLRKMLRAGEEQQCVISIVSPPYLSSIHGHTEWAQAFMHGNLKPIPVRVRTCQLTGTFRTFNYIDMAELDRQTGRSALINEMRERRGERKPAKKVLDFKQVFDGVGDVQLRHTIWNVPQSADDDFVGRTDELSKIEAALRGKRAAVLLEQAPNDGGCGSRDLALEYARMKRSSYEAVWVIRSGHRLVSMIDYLRLARELGVKEKDASSLALTIRAARTWLDTNEKWLLIFQDAESKEALAGYLPAQPKGDIIITTSIGDWAQKFGPILVGRFERESAIEYLFRRTGERNEGASAALAAAMGDLPMPLALAAGYVRAEKISIDKYIDYFLTRHRDLWGFQSPPKDLRPVAATALSVSTDLLSAKSPVGLELLKVCAYWGRSQVRLSRLASSARLFPRSLSKLLLNAQSLKEAVSLIVQLRLAEEKDDVLTFDPLVQDLVRKWIETDTDADVNDGWFGVLTRFNGNRSALKHRMAWPHAAFEFVFDSFPGDPSDEKTWEECDLLIPQFVAAMGHAQRLGYQREKVSAAWRRMGIYLSERSVFPQAADAFELAIKLHKEQFGPVHKGLPDLYKGLSRIRWKQSKLDEARQSLEAALAIEEQAFKGAHPDIAATLCNLGNVCVQLTDYARARHHYLKALEMDLKIHGKIHADVGRDYGNLGLVSQELGDLNAAWEYHRNALNVLERVKGAERLVATAIKSLGGLLYRMGDLAEAKKYYKMAIEYDIANHGEFHASVAQSYHNLAMTLEGLGFQREALEYYLKAMSTNEAVYGKNHPKVGMNKNNLGNIALRAGDYKGAEAYTKAAHDIFMHAYGENHELTETAKRNLIRIREHSKSKQAASAPKAP